MEYFIQTTEIYLRNIDMDEFFNAISRIRCGRDLSVRIMSWFNSETICPSCKHNEDVLKANLRAYGISGAMDGCGYAPDVTHITSQCVR